MIPPLTIALPEGPYETERRYVVGVLLGEFLGLPHRVVRHAEPTLSIRWNDEQALEVADVFFRTPPRDYLQRGSLPRLPLPWWPAPDFCPRLAGRQLPVLYGRDGARCYDDTPTGGRLHLDVFGSAFFMLTRYEELVTERADEHGRFPAGASVACMAGFLERPIVDEYAELLWGALQRLWPRLERAKRTPRIHLSHDVDWPYSPRGVSTGQLLRLSVGDVLKRLDAELAIKRWVQRGQSGEARRADPFNTFDFLMDASERFGLTSAFYFIPWNSLVGLDGDYTLQEPWIRQLMTRIHARGHALGFHPSYSTMGDTERTIFEFMALRQELATLGIEQREWGGRQHYLRWRNPDTWQAWEHAGLDYDSTLGYAERPGFRCGTCTPYPAFDLRTRSMLRLRERPLVAMETTLLHHLRLGPQAAAERIARLAAECRRFDGEFTLLWHNSNLSGRQDKRLYLEVLEGLANRQEAVR
ncbi:MAG TPA: polysaccharide deacetylase family protein [Oscillatoriaceae cyanobacterium]